MSKTFLVKVRALLPYPVEKEYRIACSSLATASNRGIKQFRKEKPGKKIDELSVKITALKSFNFIKYERQKS